MDEELKGLVVGVRADTAGFAADVAAMRASLEGPLAAGAERAGRAIEGSLLKAVRTGKLGFDDLQKAAVSAMDAIAASALKAGIGAVLPSTGAGQGVAAALAGVLGGLPGRATGGPVTPGRGYVVGERGPELFVPTAAGRVEPAAAAGARDVRVAITIAGPAGSAPDMLQRSSRQVARAVRVALSE
ncbi:tail tape measure protein [uncultured Sphingomonas sp.]|uniref:tail tape measure protein n=1 Tax=uncultured Sphingomonas sp. TaxID=158754 RepID=UPI0035CBF19F